MKFETYLNEVSGINLDLQYKVKTQPKDVQAEFNKIYDRLAALGIKPDNRVQVKASKISHGEFEVKKATKSTQYHHQKFQHKETFGGQWDKVDKEYSELIDKYNALPLIKDSMTWGSDSPARFIRFVEEDLPKIIEFAELIKKSKVLLEKYYLMRSYYALANSTAYTIAQG